MASSSSSEASSNDNMESPHQSTTIARVIETFENMQQLLHNSCNLIQENMNQIEPSPDVEFFNAMLEFTNSYHLWMQRTERSNHLTLLRQFANYRIPSVLPNQNVRIAPRSTLSYHARRNQYVPHRASGDQRGSYSQPQYIRSESRYDVLNTFLHRIYDPSSQQSLSQQSQQSLSQQSEHQPNPEIPRSRSNFVDLTGDSPVYIQNASNPSNAPNPANRANQPNQVNPLNQNQNERSSNVQDVINSLSPAPPIRSIPNANRSNVAQMIAYELTELDEKMCDEICGICTYTLVQLFDANDESTEPDPPEQYDPNWIRTNGILYTQTVIQFVVENNPRNVRLCGHWYHFFCIRSLLLSRAWRSLCPECSTPVVINPAYSLLYDDRELWRSVNGNLDNLPHEQQIPPPSYGVVTIENITSDKKYNIYLKLIELEYPDMWDQWLPHIQQQNDRGDQKDEKDEKDQKENDEQQQDVQAQDAIIFRIRETIPSDRHQQSMNIDNNDESEEDEVPEYEEEDDSNDALEAANIGQTDEEMDDNGSVVTRARTGQITIPHDRGTPITDEDDDDDDNKDEHKQNDNRTENTIVAPSMILNNRKREMDQLAQAPVFDDERRLCFVLPIGIRPTDLQDPYIIFASDTLLSRFFAAITTQNVRLHHQDDLYRKFLKCMLPYSEAPIPLQKEVGNDPTRWIGFARNYVLDMQTHVSFMRNTIQRIVTITGRSIAVEGLIKNPDAKIRRLYQVRGRHRVTRDSCVYAIRWILYSLNDRDAWMQCARSDEPEIEDWVTAGRPSWQHWNGGIRDQYGRYQHHRHGSTMKYIRHPPNENDDNHHHSHQHQSNYNRRFVSHRNTNRAHHGGRSLYNNRRRNRTFFHGHRQYNNRRYGVQSGPDMGHNPRHDSSPSDYSEHRSHPPSNDEYRNQQNQRSFQSGPDMQYIHQHHPSQSDYRGNRRHSSFNDNQPNQPNQRSFRGVPDMQHNPHHHASQHENIRDRSHDAVMNENQNNQ